MILKKLIQLPLLLMCLNMVACQSQQTATPLFPTYTCLKTTAPIILDGKLDEADWQNAQITEPKTLFSPKTPVDIPSTKVRFLWDDDNLYVAFECQDLDVFSYSDQHDAQLWRGDVSEIFLKPSPDKNHYYEFVIAPNGTLYDAQYPSRGAGSMHRFKKWSSNAKIVSQIQGTDNNWHDDDQGYIIEMAIPKSAFKDSGSFKAGDQWTYGACRYDYGKDHEKQLLIMTMPEAPHSGYHYYENYFPIVFKEK
ncbi:MAG: carbohydrate-binding family 9-like protein [Phycisphaeraceae bacterium]|nr:carbohydrate-binding family 9-like protein [Phycisphaeraceae bacterium]